jgi:hypothetical protein
MFGTFTSAIRAKLTPLAYRREKRVADFITQRGPAFLSVVKLIGIVSPRLAAAPSIAEQAPDLAVEVLA